MLLQFVMVEPVRYVLTALRQRSTKQLQTSVHTYIFKSAVPLVIMPNLLFFGLNFRLYVCM